MERKEGVLRDAPLLAPIRIHRRVTVGPLYTGRGMRREVDSTDSTSSIAVAKILRPSRVEEETVCLPDLAKDQ